MVRMFDDVGQSTGNRPRGNAARIVDAARECVCRWGWSKTTIDDIANEAGVSRATVYRTFPGGRDAIHDAAMRKGVTVFFEELVPLLESADSLDELLVDAIVWSSVVLRDDEPLQYQLANEPGEVLPTFAFAGLDRLLTASRVYVAPHLLRFVDRRSAVRIAEWATRLVLSHALEPSRRIDLTDRADVERLVATRAAGLVVRPSASPIRTIVDLPSADPRTSMSTLADAGNTSTHGATS